MEEKGDAEEAGKLFVQAWNEAANDFERFLSAHYVARHQESVGGRLTWLETALRCARQVDDVAVTSAFPALYARIAECHEDLGEPDKAARYRSMAASSEAKPADAGPFYHGTKADLQVGDLLTAGGSSNYQADLRMNHIYFTALVNGAGLAAALAQGEGPERVYIVEPTGPFENDPNVTDKKFPGNPTRSYRSHSPLKVIGEASEWRRQTPEDIQKWRERLSNIKGKIIN